MTESVDAFVCKKSFSIKNIDGGKEIGISANIGSMWLVANETDNEVFVQLLLQGAVFAVWIEKTEFNECFEKVEAETHIENVNLPKIGYVCGKCNHVQQMDEKDEGLIVDCINCSSSCIVEDFRKTNESKVDQDKPNCYKPEENANYPLCVGDEYNDCKNCSLFIDFDVFSVGF